MRHSPAEPNTTTETECFLRDLGEGLASINRAIVLASKRGKIRWMNALAREWLHELFSTNSAPPKVLPRPLKEKLALAMGKSRSNSRTCVHLERSNHAGGGFVIYCGRTDGGDFVIVLLRERSRIDPLAVGKFRLTPREAEVLLWISESKTNPEIATILKTSTRTVHKHVQRILAKLGVENRLAAQRVARDLRRY